MRPETVERIVESEPEAEAAVEANELAVKIEPVDTTLEVALGLIGDKVDEAEELAIAIPLLEADRETAEPELLEELALPQ